jgi:uncharacterized protein YjiS (DUF1127 family)
MEIGAMDLLHRIGQSLAAKLSEQNTVRRLQRLDDRNLADLGLVRDEIRPVARLAAQMGPQGAAIKEIVEQVRRSGEDARARRMPDNGSGSRAYTPSDLDRYVQEAHRLRADTISEFGRILRRRLAATEMGKSITLARLRRHEHARVARELESYSPQELMADLRLTRSEIHEIAADGAERAVDAFVRAHPEYRRAAGWGGHSGAVARAHG